MKNHTVIGITGGIGSGKTMLSRLLREAGYSVYDTDQEARRLQNENTDLIEATCNLLGTEVYSNRQLNRPLVASIVFKNPELLKQLTSLVHPAVKHDFIQWKQQQDKSPVFIESAVLYEGAFDELTDKVIVVTASEDIRIKRVMQRDGITRKQVIARMKHQLNEDEKIKRADIVIRTDEGMSEDVVSGLVF
jgi:dephospho-CoA kinase